MPPPILLLLLLVLLTISTLSMSSPALPTIAISHISNQTIICALFPSSGNHEPYGLNCTSFPSRGNRSYPSAVTLYSAIAAGNGFLCALGSPQSSNVSTMRWWDFAHETRNGSTPDVKRVYHGSPLSTIAASDSHVCALRGDTGGLECWRWPQLSLPAGLKLTRVSVGEDFVCGLQDSGAIRCFGNDNEVVGFQPNGSYSMVAAGARHACGISNDGKLFCWGTGAPEFGGDLSEINSLALGENGTCARRNNGTVLCWGDNVGLPKDIVYAQFIAIEAKGRVFCGILMANYSLVCWGNELFHQNHVVFDHVLPGSCTDISSCPCGVLAGSEDYCVHGSVICQACKVEYNAKPLASQGSGKNKRRLLFIILGSVGLGLGLAVVSCLFLFWFGKKSVRVHDSGRLAMAAPPPSMAGLRGRLPSGEDSTDPPLERRLSALLGKGPSSTMQEFSLRALLDATDSFSEDYKIGSGSFGAVYRATLHDGRVVAIKRAEPSASSSHAGAAAEDRRRDRESAFLSELALLSRVNHKNLLRILGYCKEGAERVLVYEYMTHGTLHDHLHKLPDSPLGSWAARLRVALDAARGIEYLHTYAVPPIIHRDIKSSNILLDESWTAKVSDFGLSLMSPDGGDASQVSLRTAGTVGYMDPEYYRLQYLTAKSDVYSFGVVLLELLSGCRAIHRNGESGTPRNVVEFAVPHIDADDIHRMLDRRLPPPTPCEIEAVACVGYLAAGCVSPQGRDRPTMTEIVGGLERALAACLSSQALYRSTTTRSV